VPRLVEIQRAEDAPATVRLQTGDVLSIGGSGGILKDGESALTFIGAFLPAVCTTTGAVVAPMGAPSIVLFVARAPGSATIEVIGGDPWSASTRTTIAIVVGP
jgi:CBS-domain-containing membrane protein